MRFLGILLRLEGIGLLGQVLRAVFRADHLAHFGQRLVRNPGRIGTHISNEADQAFFAEFHAFIEALGDHHGALHAEAELAGGILLQLAGRERRGCVAAALFAVDRTDQPVGLFDEGTNFLCVLAVGNFNLFFALADEAGVKSGRLGGGELGVDGPVFLLLEGFDLALALDDQAQGDRLDASSRKAAADFIPEQRRNLVTHQAIEHAARLLRVDQVLIDLARMLEGFAHGALRDLVKRHALDAQADLRCFLPSWSSSFCRRWCQVRRQGAQR